MYTMDTFKNVAAVINEFDARFFGGVIILWKGEKEKRA